MRVPATTKVLEVFFRTPTTKYHLRALARKAKLSAPATMNATKELIKQRLLKKTNTPPTTTYEAIDSKKFVRKKRVWNLNSIYESGLVDELAETDPQAIILFGSYSRGEDWEKSDIDLLVIEPRKKITITKILGKSVDIFTDVENLPKELQNNIINGIVLYGRWDPLQDHSPTTSEKKSTK